VKRLVLPATMAAFLVTAAPALAVPDFSGMARNIIPSGQYGGVPVPPRADQQARMYDALTPLFGNVRTRDLRHDFKSEKLGTKHQGHMRREHVPHKGVRLFRDRFDVPHIIGKTNDDVSWASGWVVAEDRELLLEQARYNSRVAVIDAPGLSAIGLVTALKSFQPSAQTEHELGKEVGKLRKYGKAGRQLLHDMRVYVKGINAFYRVNHRTHKPWTVRDVIALNAIKSQLFGQGGGNEVNTSEFLNGLQAKLGANRGYSVWNDLRQRNDPEAPVSARGRFPYAPLPQHRTGNVVLDNGSFQRVAEPGGAAARVSNFRQTMSNVLMVAGKRSKTGHPLFVGGPQIGYFYPGLTLEMDLHGPGWRARGATSAPFPGYILIGRREDFVWSLTSAGGDIVDNFVETLCGGSDRKYMYRGKCRDMRHFNAGTLDGQPVEFDRTVHGPVVGYATVNGRRVAISRKRSSYLLDGVDLLLFRKLTRGHIPNARAFIRAAAVSPQTFNTFYADSRVVAQVTTGRLPIRAPGVDSGLPTDGRGNFEWRGFLAAKGHPHGIVKSGVLNNWNNKSARDWPAADDEWGYGSITRVNLLNDNTNKHRKNTLATLTGAMNAAATQDVRVMKLVPVLARLLKGGPAPSPRAAQMLALLESWRAHGGSRLDRDLDGKIDDPGAAILDASWKRLADAAMTPVLGQPLADQLNAKVQTRFEAPPSGQRTGWYQYMHKDLRTLLGEHVRGKFANRYCGNGNVAVCRASLWAALDATGVELAAQQGPDPTTWRSDATAERIHFAPGLLPFTMRYTNRPSGIQQVIEFKGHR